jgi:hypothetical protein
VDASYPFGLRERLGETGVAALDEVLNVQRTDIVTLMTDSFERRLTAECAKLLTGVRGEMSELHAALRAVAKELRYELRADFKVEVANVRADLLKWSFVFWAGQVAILASFISVLR